MAFILYGMAGLLLTGSAVAEPTREKSSPADLSGTGVTSGKLGQLASMKVQRVKSDAPGCEPGCPEWISAEGMIDENTLPQFKRVLKELGTKKLPVLIDSGGGLVDDSLAIGRLLRARGLDIAVSKTVLAACAGAGADTGACRQARARAITQGHPRSYLARCASSCAFILAGGVRRFVGPSAFVGVHQLKTLQTSAQLLRKYRIETRTEWGVPIEVRRVLISEKRINEKTTIAKTPDSAYVRVARYFTEMNVGGSIMPILKGTPNASIHWLTRTELKVTAMATDSIDAEHVALGIQPKSSAFQYPAQNPAQNPAMQQIQVTTEVGASPISPPLPSELIPVAPAR